MTVRSGVTLDLSERIDELEAELAQASAALDDPDYLAARLARLLADHPDLRLLARHIQEQVHQHRGSPMGRSR